MDPKVNEKMLITFDYSLTSPAMCIYEKDWYHVFVVSSEKKIQIFENDDFEIFPLMYPIWNTPQQRYEYLADSFMSRIPDNPSIEFGIESYSMGSKGRVFDIAEATQTLKYKVWKKYGKEMHLFSPATVKKEFQGKGNAKKEQMAEAFEKRFGFVMHEAVSSKIKGSASDLVDAVAVNVCLQNKLAP